VRSLGSNSIRGRWHVRQAIGQQRPCTRNDVEVLAQELDLAVLDDEMADIVLCIDLVRPIDEAFGMVFDEKTGPSFRSWISMFDRVNDGKRDRISSSTPRIAS
jgi:hypothetical protein